MALASSAPKAAGPLWRHVGHFGDTWAILPIRGHQPLKPDPASVQAPHAPRPPSTRRQRRPRRFHRPVDIRLAVRRRVDASSVSTPHGRRASRPTSSPGRRRSRPRSPLALLHSKASIEGMPRIRPCSLASPAARGRLPPYPDSLAPLARAGGGSRRVHSMSPAAIDRRLAALKDLFRAVVRASRRTRSACAGGHAPQ